MGHLLKHIAIRLWTALFVGIMASLVVLAPFAGTMGPAWMVIPGFCLFAVAYWVTGIVFAMMGRHRLGRLLGEATVWERAGMSREVRQTLDRAAATVDSFFFSPLSRRVPARRLLSQMARFQLAQTEPELSSDSIVGTYLHAFPSDRDAAVKWLDRVLSGRDVTQRSHDIATRIGAVHSEDAAIQQMLAQFYIAERRCDFAALQTYRYLVKAGEPLPEPLTGDLADLFMAHSRADSLALTVYLDVHQRGGRDTRLLPGIAACCRMIHPSPLTLPLLDKVDTVLAGIDASRRISMAEVFLDEPIDSEPERPAKRRLTIRPVIGPIVRKALSALIRLASGGAAGVSSLLVKTWEGMQSRQAKSAVKWTAMGLFIIAVSWLVVNTAMHLKDTPKTVEKESSPVEVLVTDPFTIQVAAYVKETDARRYVDQLKGHELDAYWTRASGSNKTWYQVRISHFATKAEARAFGEDLKMRQLIGDYYVANYKRPDAL